MCLCSCSQFQSQSLNCPDHLRRLSIRDIPTTIDDQRNKVDDCLRETAGRLANGPSSDENVARATQRYCGSVVTAAKGEDEIAAGRLDALMFVVEDRAYKCPAPRKRNVLTGGLE